MSPVRPAFADPQARKTVLPNGLRVITETLDHVDSVSLGLWVDSGTPEEPEGRGGISHLIEHMLFKGTRARSARELAELIDDIGGNVNGLTDREFVSVYARTSADHADAGLDLVLDLFLNSVCAEEDLAREKEVVLQEIGLVEDTPEDWVHDLLLACAWPHHQLGRPVMGTTESVAGTDREALLAHLERMRSGPGLIVSAAGRLDHDHVVDMVARLTKGVVPQPAAPLPDPPAFQPGERFVSRPTNQVHLCLATPSCGRTDPRRHAYAVLDTLLGGGASSRLFQEIRENRGLAYHIGSYLQLCRGAGVLAVDAGTSPENYAEVLELVAQEVERLRTEGPLPAEVARAKTQLRVALALAAESTSFRMQHLAASELLWGRILSLQEVIAGVTAVTTEDVHALAQGLFTAGRRALVTVGPFE
jgi:predicted Zn-dependent peptidase